MNDASDETKKIISLLETLIKDGFESRNNELRAACWDSDLCPLHKKNPDGYCHICNGSKSRQFLREENNKLKVEIEILRARIKELEETIVQLATPQTS